MHADLGILEVHASSGVLTLPVLPATHSLYEGPD